MAAVYGIIAILLVLLRIGPGDSQTLLLALPDVCKSGKLDSYFIGINEARVAIIYDLTKPYPPNVDCTLHITESGVNAGVQMSFLAFDMAPAVGGVCQDYISMMKVDPADNKKKVLFPATCGSTAPANLTERVNEVIIKVKTSATQTTHKGFVLLFKKYVEATILNATPTKAPVDTALIAGAVVGAILGVILLVLLAFCVFCVFRHKRDLLRHKKGPDPRFSDYMRTANPAPLGPAGLRRTAPPPPPVANNDWRGWARQGAYAQY